MDAVDQAEASENLPTEGGSGQYHLSFDQRLLFIEWKYTPLDVRLLTFDLADESVQTIAHLRGNAVPSPVSDCIILFGTVEGEDPALINKPGFDLGPKMIDSQGQRYWFKLDFDQPQPTWGDTEFAWAPDGLQLAFTVGEDFHDSLYAANVDGSAMRPLFHNEDEYFGVLGLAWSPTGEQIAVEAFYKGADGKVQKGIFLVQVDSGERRLVVDHILASVFWSSDGQALIYKGYDGCQMLDLETEETTEVHRTLCQMYAKPGTRP